MTKNFKYFSKKLPGVLCPDYVGQHHTVADLRFLAEHELDLDEEGDISLSAKDRKAIQKFIAAIDQEKS